MSLRIQSQQVVKTHQIQSETMQPLRGKIFSKDTLEFSKEQNQQRSSFKQKVGNFFSGIWKWIIGHLLCCFYRKKGDLVSKADPKKNSAASSHVLKNQTSEVASKENKPAEAKPAPLKTEQKSVLPEEKTETKESRPLRSILKRPGGNNSCTPYIGFKNSTEKMSETEKRFSALSSEEQTEWRLALQKFMKVQQKIYSDSNRIKFAIYEEIIALPAQQASKENIMGIISKSGLVRAELSEEMRSYTFDPELYIRQIPVRIALMKYTEKNLEILAFSAFLQKEEPSRLEIEAVFGSLSPSSKEELLIAHRQANNISAFEESDLLLLLQKDPYGKKFTKTTDRIYFQHAGAINKFTNKLSRTHAYQQYHDAAKKKVNKGFNVIKAQLRLKKMALESKPKQ